MSITFTPSTQQQFTTLFNAIVAGELTTTDLMVDYIFELSEQFYSFAEWEEICMANGFA